MIHFKDNKNKSALSTRWAQMSKQEQIIEKKKMEIQAKLEAQKNAAALAAQAKLSNPALLDDSSSKNIFSNDGSFMSQYKALLEKQSKEKQEKEEKEKQERQEKNEELQRKKNEAKQKSEQSSQEVDYDSDQNYPNDKRDLHEGRHRERNRRWDRSRNRGHSPFTPTVEDRKPHDTNHIPSLMQLSVKPPDRSPNRSRWNRDDSDSNDDYERKTKQEFDSDSSHAPDNMNSQPGPDFINGPMGPRPMGLMGPGPMGGHGPMGPRPMGFGPGPMGRGQMGHMPMGPRPMGPGPMGPGPMGPGPMGPGPMGAGPMGPGPMGPGPMGHGPMGPRPMGPGPMRPGPMGPGQMGHSSGMMPPGTSNNNAGPGQNVGNNNSNIPGNSNNPNMGQGNPNMPPNMGQENSNMPPNMGQGNSNMPPNMGPGNLNRPQGMGPGNPNMPPNMGPGNSNMPPMPFMGGPPNFPMPPNFMGPNGPRGPCGPMPPNMCGPHFRGPRPNGPMPPFFPPNGPPNSMMPPNMNNDQRFMGPQPPFGPNGPNFGPNRPNFGPNGPNFGPSGPNFGPNNMGNMPFMPPNSMPPPGDEQSMDSMKHSSMRPNEHENKKVLSADTFQSIHRAASEVSSNGDHWESVLKAMNSQDQSLWFLHNTNSNEYKMYRDLVSKMRNEKQIKKEEIKPEDKYEPEFSLEDDDSNDKPYYKDDNSSGSNYQQTQFGLKREASSQSDEETETKQERRKKRKSRWGDDPPVDIKPPGVMVPPPLPGVQLAKIDEEGIKLSTLNRNNQALMQYALTNYGTTNLSAEDWQKCEDNFKLNLLFQDMLKKRQEVERLAAAGKHKYEYDSDEDTAEGTWEHKLRAKEMNATEKWADELTKQAEGKHHIGDFLPPEELKKFMEKYSAAKSGGKEPDLSDYKEYKLGEDNVGFKMLQKLGWNEGQGLGVEGTGIIEPINKGNQPVANMGLGAKASDIVNSEDDEFDAYRKRMMLAYRFRPNPLNNPRRPYY